mgnify:FL=1
MKTVSAPTQSILPESVRNIIASVNCASRVVLKTCEGTERAVTGVDEVATLMLKQQQQRLIAEMEARYNQISPRGCED